MHARVRTLMPIVCALLLAAALPAGVADWTVRLRGVGPIRFGMPVGEVERVLGASLGTVRRTECDYARAPSMPAGMRVMVERGRVVRVDVDSLGVRTASGAAVGMTEDELRALYPGQIRTEPHKYTGPEGHYLVYLPRDHADLRYRLIFETDGHVVTQYRAGLRPQVEYVEGCS